jgi:hypothetical protein
MTPTAHPALSRSSGPSPSVIAAIVTTLLLSPIQDPLALWLGQPTLAHSCCRLHSSGNDYARLKVALEGPFFTTLISNPTTPCSMTPMTREWVMKRLKSHSKTTTAASHLQPPGIPLRTHGSLSRVFQGLKPDPDRGLVCHLARDHTSRVRVANLACATSLTQPLQCTQLSISVRISNSFISPALVCTTATSRARIIFPLCNHAEHLIPTPIRYIASNFTHIQGPVIKSYSLDLRIAHLAHSKSGMSLLEPSSAQSRASMKGAS